MDNFYSRCLLCTCRPDVTPHLHIFSDVGKQLQLADKIKHLNIQIEAELPQNVCHSCMEKLEVTHELVTSSQQARIMLLQMKQQSEEVKQENCSMTELDSYQPATDSAAIDNEMEENEIPLDNCSAEDFDQSHSALHCTTEGTVEHTEAFEEVEIEIEEHAIKLEPGEDQLDCLPQNSQCRDVALTLIESKLAECRVLVAKLLKCDFCCFYTDNKTQLATHMQAHLHTSDGFRSPPALEGVKFTHKCAQCGIKFANPEMLAWHTENCHGTDAIVKVVTISDKRHDHQCVFCATVCKEVNTIIQHLHSQHRISNLPFHCNSCEKTFITKSKLKRHRFACKKTVSASKNCENYNISHMKNSSKHGGVKCKLCSEVFKSEKLMKNHISEFHAVSKERYKCRHCEESFISILHLKSHCHSKHPGMHLLQCDLCKAGFTAYRTYLEHKMFKHAAPTLTCNICNKKFVTNFGYRYHKKYTHGTQVFTCNVCSATFSSPDSLSQHIKSQHLLLENRFSCNICERKFNLKKDLQRHIRDVHAGPILNCQHCQYSTRRRCNFNRHIRSQHFESL